MADYTLSAKITGDSSGFEKAFSTAQKTLDNFEAKTMAISSKISNVGKSITSVGDKLTKNITVPASAAASALTGITAVKGFNRLVGIDDAKAKLKGLGHDAQSVEDIMNSALESVKGTAYGLDEAATTAASAVAAGIKPGQELTRYLSLTADAAAIAGDSMAEMGSIINKVQTSQVAYTEDLNQLADRGIPIYQWLADSAGVAASEVKEMASKGAISSEMFLDAIEKNIGGAAKIMGESSFSASLANIGATISRIGANFLDAGGKGGGFFSTLKPMLADFNENLGVLEDKAADLGVKFGESFSKAVSKLDELKSKFLEMDPSMQGFIVKSTGVGTAFAVGIGPGLKVAGELTEKIGSITGKINSISSMGKGAFDSLKSGMESVHKLGGEVSNALEAVGLPFKDFGKKYLSILPNDVKGMITGVVSQCELLKSGVQEKVSSISEAFRNSPLGNVFSSISGKIKSFASTAGTYLGVIGESFSPLLQKAASFAPQFLSFLNVGAGIGLLLVGLGLIHQAFGGQLDSLLLEVQQKGPELITNLCNGIVSKIPDLIAQGAMMVGNLLSTITALLPSVIKGGADIISSLVIGLAQQMPTLIPKAVEVILTLSIGLLNNLPQIINAGFQLIIGLAQGLINSIPNIINALPQIIQSLLTGILTYLPQLVTTGIQLIVQLAVGLVKAIPQMVAKIPEIIKAIKKSFKSVDWGELGLNIIKGIAGGLSDAGHFLIDAAKKAAESALDAIKEKLGIHSPSRVFRDEVGRMMALGLGVGFEKNIPVKNLKSSVSKLTSEISGMKTSIGITSIPKLARGTDYWQCGYAYMNEGGRGELTYLPNGTQVIPHDISVKYAKEAARSNNTVEPLDVHALGAYIVEAVTTQGRQQSEALESGISNMKMTLNQREMGRFFVLKAEG